MSPLRPRPATTAAGAGPSPGRQELWERLGCNVPAAWWPTAPMLKGIEAAGFGWVQVHAPPRSVLEDRGQWRRHAIALRARLDTGGLRLVMHGPDDLSVGRPDHEAAFDGLIDYARAVRAEYVVYHGANLECSDGGAAAARTRERFGREEEILRSRADRMLAAGFCLAVENLAPVWPGPPRLCHSVELVRAMVARLDHPAIGMLLDVGHANITARLSGGHLRALVASVADQVVLFHLHDNLGARTGPDAPGLDPLRLDLHLAPGAGKLPWDAIGAQLVQHGAPLMLEVHPPHRPEPLPLATVTAELLLRERVSVEADRPTLAAGTDPRRPTVPLG